MLPHEGRWLDSGKHFTCGELTGMKKVAVSTGDSHFTFSMKERGLDIKVRRTEELGNMLQLAGAEPIICLGKRKRRESPGWITRLLAVSARRY